jgi:hypothetical protein
LKVASGLNSRIAIVRMSNLFEAFHAWKDLNLKFMREYSHVLKLRITADDTLVEKLESFYEKL